MTEDVRAGPVVLDRLFETIASRRGADPEAAYGGETHTTPDPDAYERS